ncbi:hypothetical protein [Membranihabitans marinus]|uniref:hypothetical protein n=1 Tax=Membranihabitans marinus TaxID=1227546 RepID=UPI001F20D2B8|nr:hypothetical protein [Membranihabitans marinus]
MKISIFQIGFLAIFLMVSKLDAQQVSFQESPKVDRAMENYINAMQNTTELSGYRILYFFTNDRREMEEVEKRFVEKFDFIPHDWVHDQPYYNLYAGSFLSKYKAMNLLSQLREDFPAAVLVNAKVTKENVYESRLKIQ